MPDTSANEPLRALVTGGARRIGRVIATALADAGYDVAVHANRSAESAQALCDELAGRGVKTATISADLGNPCDVDRLIPAAREAIGPLSLLVNNASVFEDDPDGRVASAGFRLHSAVNAEAPLRLALSFAQQAEGNALVVNMVDQRVLRPTPRFLSYSASKATLWWLTQTLAQALAPKVRVMAVGPGPVMKSARQDEADFDALAKAVLLERAPDPSDIASAVLFCHRTRSLTGQMIAVDGGQHLAWKTADAIVPE